MKERTGLQPGAKLALQAYAFLLPSFLGLLVFSRLPIIAVAILSFFNWGLIAQPTFIGLKNYTTLFSNASFWHSLLVTFYYVLLNIPMQAVLALLLAMLLNQKIPGRGIFRTLFVVPWMATPVALGLVWQWIFDPQYGALNTFLGVLHIPGPSWLSSPAWAMPAIAAVNIWQYTGYNMLFFLAGLQGIPPDFYEAASLDGAGPIERFFTITLPLLSPTMFFVLVTSVIGSAQVFDTVYVMTKGGPGEATSVINFNIFRQAFEFFPLSRPIMATLGIITFVGAWNNFLWLLIITDSDNLRVLTVGLAAFQSNFGTQWNLMMAGTFIALGPLLILFFLFQKHIVRSIHMSGFK